MPEWVSLSSVGWPPSSRVNIFTRPMRRTSCFWPTKASIVDLTSARCFIESATHHSHLLDLVDRHVQTPITFAPGRLMKPRAVLQVLLGSLRSMHAIWRLRRRVTDEEVVSYRAMVGKFAQCWAALRWKGTVWVHWVIVHSRADWGSQRHNFQFWGVGALQRRGSFFFIMVYRVTQCKSAPSFLHPRWEAFIIVISGPRRRTCTKIRAGCK